MNPLLILAIIGLIGSPVAVDSTLGDGIDPSEGIMYSVERIGEVEKSVVGLLPPEERMDERLGEYESELTKGVDDQNLLDEAENEAVNTEDQISKDNQKAAGTPDVQDDMRALARHQAFQERYRLHLQKLEALKARLPEAAQPGISNAIQHQTQKLTQLADVTEAMRTTMEERLQTPVQVQVQDGQAVVALPENPAVTPIASEEIESKSICSVPPEIYKQVLADGIVTQSTIDSLMAEAWINPRILMGTPVTLATQVLSQGRIPEDSLQQLPPDLITRISLECNVPPELTQKVQSGDIKIQSSLVINSMMLQKAVRFQAKAKGGD